jgi:ankyrin repeat domain-containing protein 17
MRSPPPINFNKISKSYSNLIIYVFFLYFLGHTDVADLLLKWGADLEHESEGGRTPLMKAVRAGHYCTAKFLISKGANVNKATTNNDHTPLSLACAGGHLAIVELLLQNKADPYHKLKVCSIVIIQIYVFFLKY